MNRKEMVSMSLDGWTETTLKQVVQAKPIGSAWCCLSSSMFLWDFMGLFMGI